MTQPGNFNLQLMCASAVRAVDKESGGEGAVSLTLTVWGWSVGEK